MRGYRGKNGYREGKKGDIEGKNGDRQREVKKNETFECWESV